MISCSTRAEKRLARTLLLLARYGDERTPRRVLPKISQETLAEMVGHHAIARQRLHQQVPKAGTHHVQRHADG